MIDGYYYLHTNGELIYKRNSDGISDLRDSDFVKAFWALDVKNRETAWQLLIEALAAGANKARVEELAKLWNCNDKDADTYAALLGVQLSIDGDAWGATCSDFIDLQASPAGFGDTALEAMAELCNALGYVPQKTWGATFKSLTGNGI